MSGQTSAERDGILRLCQQAGVLTTEMWDDPQHGLCVSLAGVRKLAVLAPDQTAVYALLKELEAKAGPGKPGTQ